MRRFYVISGGTFNHIDCRTVIGDLDFGATGRILKEMLVQEIAKQGDEETFVHLIQTRMALGGSVRSKDEVELLKAAGLADLGTNEDLQKLVYFLEDHPNTKCIAMAAAVADFECMSIDPSYGSTPGQHHPHLSSTTAHSVSLIPAHKIIRNIRKLRKDIFLVAFKETNGKTPDEMHIGALAFLKRNSANLVFAKDTTNGWNMIISPEHARYCEGRDPLGALEWLARMIVSRSMGTFSRTTVFNGNSIPWTLPPVSDTFRTIVDYCIRRGVYKPFSGSTPGYFVMKVCNGEFFSSQRNIDFNGYDGTEMIRVCENEDGHIIAHGGLPSIGIQDARTIFNHSEMDCVIHFHSPRKIHSLVPVHAHFLFECGSRECGQNTFDSLAGFDNGTILAVMLYKHGPTIAFKSSADPKQIIDFIEANFDLAGRTDDIQALEPVVTSR